MANVLAQDLIRRDIEIVDLYQGIRHTFGEIDNYIQQLKHDMYHGLNKATVGKIVYVDTNDFFIVVCSMIAAWELGSSLFLNDTDPKAKNLPYFKKFYDVIDVVIGPKQNSQWVPKHAVHIMTDHYKSDKAITRARFNENLDQALTPDTVCYYTTSSGTTGDPKLLPFTHYQTVTISNEIKNYLALSESSRPYHFKTLHHSSLFNSFALPLLNSCQTHYCGLFGGGAKEFLTTVSHKIKNYGLTHFLVPYNWIRSFNTIDAVDFDNNVTLITIQGNTDQEMKDFFYSFRPKQVINYFGTSEVGTMFISRTTAESLADYNPNKFVDVTSYIDYEILENQVKVKWKHIDEWYVVSDKMIVKDHAIWLFGRDLYFSVRGKQLELAQMQDFIKHRISSDNFTLVPDYKLEKLYLNVYDSDMTTAQFEQLNADIQLQFGSEFTLSDMFNFAREDLEYGMKINGSLLLFLFRERNR